MMRVNHHSRHTSDKTAYTHTAPSAADGYSCPQKAHLFGNRLGTFCGRPHTTVQFRSESGDDLSGRRLGRVRSPGRVLHYQPAPLSVVRASGEGSVPAVAGA